jgi:hypothetical protein
VFPLAHWIFVFDFYDHLFEVLEMICFVVNESHRKVRSSHATYIASQVLEFSSDCHFRISVMRQFFPSTNFRGVERLSEDVILPYSTL